MSEEDRAEELPISGQGTETQPLGRTNLSSLKEEIILGGNRECYFLNRAPMSSKHVKKKKKHVCGKSAIVIQPMLLIWRGGKHTGVMSLASVLAYIYPKFRLLAFDSSTPSAQLGIPNT